MNPLENYWGALIAAGVLFLLLVILRLFRPRMHRLTIFAPPLIVIAAGFALDHFVATDKERIRSFLVMLSEAVEAENTTAISAMICRGYSDSFHKNKESLMRHCSRRLQKPLVEKNVFTIISMQLAGNRADVTVSGRTILEEQSYAARNYKRLFFSKVNLELHRREDDRWCLQRAELLELDRHPAGWRTIGTATF